MLKSQFMSFYRGTANEQSASQCYDAIEKALYEQGILTRNTLIGALATVRVEVGKAYKPIEEYASGDAYEGRASLGNLQAGDGRRFKGRGYIQLTGRKNYTKYGSILGIDLVNNPELALDINIASKIFAQYFKENNCNTACDSYDWKRVRTSVNGGLNGYDTFMVVINQFLQRSK